MKTSDTAKKRRTAPNIEKLQAAAVNENVGLGALEAAALIGVSRTAWYGLLRDGKAPQPDFRINARVVRWQASTLKRWMAGLKAA